LVYRQRLRSLVRRKRAERAKKPKSKRQVYPDDWGVGIRS
jgi:ribosomal 50S subunit-associated protein YjgA (DUF615 family)